MKCNSLELYSVTDSASDDTDDAITYATHRLLFFEPSLRREGQRSPYREEAVASRKKGRSSIDLLWPLGQRVQIENLLLQFPLVSQTFCSLLREFIYICGVLFSSKENVNF